MGCFPFEWARVWLAVERRQSARGKGVQESGTGVKSAYADFDLRKYLVQRGRNRRKSASSPILTILETRLATTNGHKSTPSLPSRKMNTPHPHRCSFLYYFCSFLFHCTARQDAALTGRRDACRYVGIVCEGPW